MARRLRFSRSTSAPPVNRISHNDAGERPRASSTAGQKLNDDAPPELCKIIMDVGAHGKRQSRKGLERRNSYAKSSSGSHSGIHKIVKDIGAHDQTISQKDAPYHSTSKTSRNSHPEIQKIIKDIGTHEQTPNHTKAKSTGSVHPEIKQIIKEVAISERRRSQPNQTSEGSQKSLSRRASLSFLRRSKSFVAPKSSPPQKEMPAIPEVVVSSPISPANGRSKRSASAPTPPSADLLDDATLEALATMPSIPPIRPSRPAFTNATPRAETTVRQRSTSVGQYSLFPKPMKTPSPSTSPVIRPIRRPALPPVPPMPTLNKDKELPAHKSKAPSTSAIPEVPESQKPHLRKLSIQIPVKAERPIPEPEPMPVSEPQSRPTSSQSTTSRKSKRVTFLETGPEIIGPSSRKSSPERRQAKSPPRHTSWSSVFTSSETEKVAQPSLSRHTSLPAARSSLNSNNTKSILRRTSSFHDSAVGDEEKKKTEEIPERIPENPMMVKNLKRLPRRNTRKSQPLPASLSGVTTPVESPLRRANSEAAKYVRHPIIIPIATMPSSSASSTPTSTRSSYYSSDSSNSSNSSRTSYASSFSPEETNLFRTVSEPVRFSKSKSPVPRPSSITSAQSDVSSSPPPLPSTTSIPASTTRVRAWSSGHTAAKPVATIVAAEQCEGRYLKSGSNCYPKRARAESSAPPPVPPLPKSIGAF